MNHPLPVVDDARKPDLGPNDPPSLLNELMTFHPVGALTAQMETDAQLLRKSLENTMINKMILKLGFMNQHRSKDWCTAAGHVWDDISNAPEAW